RVHAPAVVTPLGEPLHHRGIRATGNIEMKGSKGVSVAIENRKAKTQKAQQVINRLSERWYQGRDEPFPECKLGREPSTRRGGKCSACTIKAEFEFDGEVSRL